LGLKEELASRLSDKYTKKPQCNAGAFVNSKVFSFMRGGEALRSKEQGDHQVERKLMAQEQHYHHRSYQQMKVKGHQIDQGLHHQLALSIH
jgi:hypothetical protein